MTRKTKSKLEAPAIPVLTGIPLVIDTPAGLCPVKLQSTDKEAVRSWAVAVTDHGQKNLKTYTFRAIKYFIRHFYDINSPEYRVVCRHLSDWLNESPLPEVGQCQLCE